MKLKQETAFKHAFGLFTYLLIVWGCYRLLFQLPEATEEFIIKPLIWLVPVVYLLSKEKLGLDSIGVTGKNFFHTIYFGLGVGVFLAIEGFILHQVKHGGIEFYSNYSLWAALGTSLMTATVEELTFRGFIFTRFQVALKQEWVSHALTALVWVLIHMPIAIINWNYSVTALISYSLVLVMFSLGSSIVFARSRNIISPILFHVFLQWPILLFR